MAATPISPVVRDILRTDINMPADEVIRRAQARGVRAPVPSIRDSVHNIKSELRRQAAKTAPAAARATVPPKASASPSPVLAKEAEVSPPISAPLVDLSAVFATVALVNKVVGAAGGVEAARQVADAVRACGGVDAFLQHLDLLAGIRTAGATA